MTTQSRPESRERPAKRRRRTSEEVRQAAIHAELVEVRRLLDQVAGLQRFLLANRLIQDGHAKDLREAVAIAKDPDRLRAAYPEAVR